MHKGKRVELISAEKKPLFFQHTKLRWWRSEEVVSESIKVFKKEKLKRKLKYRQPWKKERERAMRNNTISNLIIFLKSCKWLQFRISKIIKLRLGNLILENKGCFITLSNNIYFTKKFTENHRYFFVAFNSDWLQAIKINEKEAFHEANEMSFHQIDLSTLFFTKIHINMKFDVTSLKFNHSCLLMVDSVRL